MRLIPIAIILIVLAQPARAVTVSTLVSQCTPFANSGFTLEDPESLSCMYYFVATVEMAETFCIIKRNGEKGWAIERYAADVSVSKHTYAVIQSFLNWAKQTPEFWNLSAIAFSPNYVTNKFPCSQ